MKKRKGERERKGREGREWGKKGMSKGEREGRREEWEEGDY